MLAEYIDKIRGPYASRVSTLTRSGGFMLAEHFDKIRGRYAGRVL